MDRKSSVVCIRDSRAEILSAIPSLMPRGRSIVAVADVEDDEDVISSARKQGTRREKARSGASRVRLILMTVSRSKRLLRKISEDLRRGAGCRESFNVCLYVKKLKGHKWRLFRRSFQLVSPCGY